jgi:hypothetical protein
VNEYNEWVASQFAIAPMATYHVEYMRITGSNTLLSDIQTPCSNRSSGLFSQPLKVERSQGSQRQHDLYKRREEIIAIVYFAVLFFCCLVKEACEERHCCAY